MKLTREKLVHLSHLIVDALEREPGARLKLARNEVRLKVVDGLRDIMKIEDEIDAAIRRKISSQRRDIPEGSREWDVLYRKYYEEEAARFRKLR